MKLKQVSAFIITFLCMLAIICLTGLVAGKMISLGWFFVLVVVLGIVMQRSINYLDRQIKDGEWL